MTLRELLAGVDVIEANTDLDQDIGYVRDDSRQVQKGDVFVAVPGRTVDGHDFVEAAIENGARAVVVERDVDAPSQVIVKSAARAVGIMAANQYGNPASKMVMVGVTGTNGKTTTTHLVESIIKAAGGRPGIIGTVSNRYAGVVKPADYTTPTAVGLQALLREMLDAGTTHVVMEVTSLALDQARVAGIFFHAGAFTNLTQDHLDYHGTMEAYFDAKALLFSRYLRAGDGVAVAYVDFDYGKQMLEHARGRKIACSTEGRADVWVERADFSIDGIDADLMTPRGPLPIKSPLLAAHNLQNIVVAVGVAEALGLPYEAIRAGLAALRGVAGRLERVELPGPAVLVDYAHTPDALERAIAAVRPLTKGKLVVVFGCGGDRDRGKRPKMGLIGARDADLAIITSDNPRTEDPQSIVEMIVAGAKESGRDNFAVEVDRRAAIRKALAQSTSGDTVLIAGKGHEDYQILGKTKIHFDDREEARAAAEALVQGKGS